MSHFAELDKDNIVTRVLVGKPDLSDEDALQWMIDNIGGTWVQTSYNARIRKNYAGIGFTYSEALDAFIAPKPYDSWSLNEDTCKWEAPTPYPTDGKVYLWDEPTLSWKVVE